MSKGKARKRRSSKRSDQGDDEDLSPEDYTKFGGFIMVVLGAIFGYGLVNSPWDVFNAIPKLIGVVFCLFVVFGGVLLLLPVEARPQAIEALSNAFAATLRAIVSIGREMYRQIEFFRERRREKKEKEIEETAKP